MQEFWPLKKTQDPSAFLLRKTDWPMRTVLSGGTPSSGNTSARREQHAPHLLHNGQKYQEKSSWNALAAPVDDSW